MTMIAVTYGYARVSKADDESESLDTQFHLLAEHGIRPDLVFSDVASGRNQAELTRRKIGIVAIRENIDIRQGSAAGGGQVGQQAGAYLSTGPAGQDLRPPGQGRPRRRSRRLPSRALRLHHQGDRLHQEHRGRAGTGGG